MLPTEQPSIALNGTPNLAREYEAFVQGIELFSTVSILVNQEVDTEVDDDEEEETEIDSTDDEPSATAINKLMFEHKLDNCNVQVYPPLNPDHEYFRLPTNFMAHLGIHHKETKKGIVIYGTSQTSRLSISCFSLCKNTLFCYKWLSLLYLTLD